MKSIYIVKDTEGNIVAWARNLVEAIGNKEYKERNGYVNLTIKRIYEDNEQYEKIIKKIFKKIEKNS